MSNIEFKLISPDKLKETCQTDWRLSFYTKMKKKKRKEKKSFRIHFLKKISLFIVFFYNVP